MGTPSSQDAWTVIQLEFMKKHRAKETMTEQRGVAEMQGGTMGDKLGVYHLKL